MRYALVVPAAGSVRRFGASILRKQYEPLAGATVIEHALAPFLADARCHRLVVAVAADDAAWPQVGARCEARAACPIGAVTGGAERAGSVHRALVALQEGMEADEWVLVHDAARPCLAPWHVDKLVRELAHDEVGGLLAVPVADTLKRADEHRHVCETVPRDSLWQAQTPQMFRYAMLRRALEGAREVTDEASAIEAAGLRPRLVQGDATNLKVTYPLDLHLAEWILENREGHNA